MRLSAKEAIHGGSQDGAPGISLRRAAPTPPWPGEEDQGLCLSFHPTCRPRVVFSSLSTSRIKDVRKNIARIQTVISSKEA